MSNTNKFQEADQILSEALEVIRAVTHEKVEKNYSNEDKVSAALDFEIEILKIKRSLFYWL